MEEFQETELNGVKLRVYRDGTIMKYYLRSRTKPIGWNILDNVPNCKNNYYILQINHKRFLVHRIIAMVYLGLDISNTKIEVDHIDRCRTNNHIDNLRIVSHKENAFNTNSKGYSWHKQHKKWYARITLNRKCINIGLFMNEEDARNAYLEAKAKYHVINPHPHPLEI
jgi:hypothetical protein